MKKFEKYSFIEIRKRLRDAIMQSGKTQQEIAIYVGVSEQTVSKYKKMIALPKYDVLALICEITETTPNYIIWGVD